MDLKATVNTTPLEKCSHACQLQLRGIRLIIQFLDNFDNYNLLGNPDHHGRKMSLNLGDPVIGLGPRDFTHKIRKTRIFSMLNARFSHLIYFEWLKKKNCT